jgi:hypothetical protein
MLTATLVQKKKKQKANRESCSLGILIYIVVRRKSDERLVIK